MLTGSTLWQDMEKGRYSATFSEHRDNMAMFGHFHFAATLRQGKSPPVLTALRAGGWGDEENTKHVNNQCWPTNRIFNKRLFHYQKGSRETCSVIITIEKITEKFPSRGCWQNHLSIARNRLNIQHVLKTSSLLILANNQLDVLFYVFIYFISLHVSSITLLIIRRSNCINTSSGMINLCKWLFGMPDRHTKQSLTQTNHTRWCTSTIPSPDDEQCDVRNM